MDPVGGTLGSSQSWNRYTYVRDNPINRFDPFGMADKDKKPCKKGQPCAEGATAGQPPSAEPKSIAIHVGATLTHDANVREQYVTTVTKLAPEDSAGRTAAKMLARSKSSPLGKGISETLRPAAGEASRVGGSANKTNAAVDFLATKGGRVVGRSLLATALVSSAYRIETAPKGQRTRTAFGEAGSWVGAWSFGAAGGTGGAAIGTLIEPGGGTVIGAVSGGVGASLLGGRMGERAGLNLYDILVGR